MAATLPLRQPEHPRQQGDARAGRSPGWLTIFQLLPYASELNPVESICSLLKRSLANLVKRGLSELTSVVKTRLRRIQHRPGLLNAFPIRTRFDLTPLL